MGLALIFFGAVLFTTAFVLFAQMVFNGIAECRRARSRVEHQRLMATALSIQEKSAVDFLGGHDFLPVITTRTFFSDPWEMFREYTLDKAVADHYFYLIVWPEPDRSEVRVAACNPLPSGEEGPYERFIDHQGETYERKRHGKGPLAYGYFVEVDFTEWYWYENPAGDRYLFFYQRGREWVGRYGVNVPLKNLRVRYGSLA